jgi:hypothetical protein
MNRPSLVLAVSKLAVVGEHAGFSLEQLIQLLDAGLSVETLIDLIAWRLEATQGTPRPLSPSSCWIM